MTTNACQFWLSNNAGSDLMQLPVLPEQIDINCDQDNTSVSVAGLGEVTIIQSPSAKTYEFESFFPAQPFQGSIAEVLPPQDYVDKIEEWIQAGTPVKFTVTGTKISTFCSIESFKYYEKGGDPDTLYYSIELKEYREVTVRKLDTTPTVPAATGADATGSKTKTATVNKKSGSKAKLYKKKSTSGGYYYKMKHKAALTVYSTSGSYVYAQYDKKKKKGYVLKKYVKYK